MTEYAEGGTIPEIRFQRDKVGPTVEEEVVEARILGFAAGVVVGVAWMLVVLLVADRVLG